MALDAYGKNAPKIYLPGNKRPRPVRNDWLPSVSGFEGGENKLAEELAWLRPGVVFMNGRWRCSHDDQLLES